MLPALYHAHLELNPDDLSFWIELAHQHRDPILELGCGTGRLMHVLSNAGHRIFGLDNDFRMLAFLRRHHSAQSLLPQSIIQADFTGFHLALSFGLILMPCNTYSTISAQNRLSLLACVRRHLHSGGVFAASMPNPEALMQIPSQSDPQVEETFPHPETGEPVQVLSAWERSDRELTVRWHYDHLLMDGSVQRSSIETKHKLISTQTYLDELTHAGFSPTTLLGDFDHSPYKDDSPFLIFLAYCAQ